ncbi:hypothetical protein [Parvibaculum sp.]|uniref:hypothetical protein n=1 Tax=Parvibaculum sp. TaxID=2024848 RepID=UPI003BA9E58C
MTKIGNKLLISAAGAALLFAPLSAMAQTTVVTDTAPAGTYYDPATGAVTTTTVTTTTVIGQRANIADPVAWLEDKGYSNIEQVAGVTKDDQMAFHAADGMGQPVEIVMDKATGEVVRETNLRKVDTPSKP